MRVVIFHPVLLPPKDYGGVERVVLWLTEALLELGHEVSVGALTGSQLPPGANLIAVHPEKKSALTFLDHLPQGTDVVHFMAPPEVGAWEKLPCAGLLTIHGNGKIGEVFPKNSVFLTQDHAQRHGRKVFVWNGINPREYIYREEKAERAPFLFLSKTSWKVKNLVGAISICARLKVNLKIAGGNRPYLLRLKAWVLGLDWQGPVSGKKKSELLAEACALLFPIRWPEPFGLVMIEAMISGTPVVASRLGSVPEILGDCGVLVEPDDQAGWDRAMRDVKQISRARCRERALGNFTHLHMAGNYLKLYQQVIEGKELSL